MNNENGCGSAKHCNLILLLCGDTLISNSQFSIFHFEREGFDGYCSFHCTLCYALYQKHRPVSDAAGTGLLDLRPVSYTHLLQNRASSVRKIYSQIALVQLCGIALVRKTVLKRDEKRVSCRRILRSAAHLLQ